MCGCKPKEPKDKFTTWVNVTLVLIVLILGGYNLYKMHKRNCYVDSQISQNVLKETTIDKRLEAQAKELKINGK